MRQCSLVGQIERLSNKGYNFPRDKGPGNLARSTRARQPREQEIQFDGLEISGGTQRRRRRPIPKSNYHRVGARLE